MIEEIIKLRGDGLSFRKIASELNTTVGKVQYRWTKWLDHSEKKEAGEKEEMIKVTPPTDCLTSPEDMPLKGEMKAKLVSPRKIILFWEVSEIPKKIIESFFSCKFDNLVPFIRLYDVTDLIFNGQNAHHFYEIAVPYKNGHWFIKGLTSNRSFVAELGVSISGTSFFPLLRSNCIETPKSELTYENYRTNDILQLKQYEEQQPKWFEHVSTYSYYVETKNLEEKNE
jgi:uncharacterized protein